jgi:hypothetical protein
VKYRNNEWTVVLLEEDEFQRIEPSVLFHTTLRRDQECEAFILSDKRNPGFVLARIYMFRDGRFYVESYVPVFLQAEPADKEIYLGIIQHQELSERKN